MIGKVANGFHPKKRSKQEIDVDYQQNAVQAGHKMRVMAQLQRELDNHLERLEQINTEAMKLPVEEQAEPEPAEVTEAEAPVEPPAETASGAV